MSGPRPHALSAEALAARRQRLIGQCQAQRRQLSSQVSAIGQGHSLWMLAGQACLRHAKQFAAPRLSRMATYAWLAYRLFTSLSGLRKR
jgi:hypothetical protein